MIFAMRSCRVVIEAHTCLVWAFLLLVLPLSWMAAFFLASAVHETFHLGVLLFLRKPILEFRIGLAGMKMEIPELSYRQELVCALAGPLGGLCLTLCNRWYPELAMCALVQSVYNLLPIYPLDGGRALRCLAHMLLRENADILCAVSEVVTIVLIFAAGIWLKWSLMVFFMGILLVIKTGFVKIPCKPSLPGVQ